MVFSDTNFWQHYKQAKLGELADRVCVLVLFVAFVGAIFTHQPPAVVAILLVVLSQVFVFVWLPSIQASCSAEVELRDRHEQVGYAIPYLDLSPMLESVVFPAETPPPRHPWKLT